MWNEVMCKGQVMGCCGQEICNCSKKNYILWHQLYRFVVLSTDAISIRKVLRPATSTQVFLGFPVSKSEC
jgi:hypothetical protein